MMCRRMAVEILFVRPVRSGRLVVREEGANCWLGEQGRFGRFHDVDVVL